MMRSIPSLVRVSILVAAPGLLALQGAARGQLHPGNLLGGAQTNVPTRWGAPPAGTLVLDQAATCQPSWLPTFGQAPGTNSDVLALAVFDDGSGPALYVGGQFTTAGGVLANSIAKWDGVTWSVVGLGMNPTSTVSALAVFDDGSGGGPALFAGGNFVFAGSGPASGIAKWNGSDWSALGTGLSGGAFGTLVNALTVFDDGSGPALYAGGNFTAAGDDPASAIAKWDGSSWSALGSGIGGAIEFTSVNSLAVFDDGSGSALYAGGNFTSAGGVAASSIAKWDGSSWSALGSGFGFDDTVVALATFDDGTGPALYAGGHFTSAGGVAASNIAKWDGSNWSAVGTGLEGDNAYVLDLMVFDDGTGPALHAGGSFTTAGGLATRSIAKWDGSSWSALGSGLNGAVEALGVFDAGSGPELHAGGSFTDDFITDGIQKWNGATWSGLGGGLNGWVNAFAVFDDGSGPALYAGGSFTTTGSVAASYIAKWNGSNWSALGSGVSAEVHFGAVYVSALTVYDDGSGPALYAAGNFTSAGDVPANGIARWDGSSWSALGSGVGNGVLALAAFDDGGGPALYAGGSSDQGCSKFTCPGLGSLSVILKWDGSSWSPWTSGIGSAGTGSVVVHSLTVFDDGSGAALYAAGDFDVFGSVLGSNVAKLDGSIWTTLGVGLNNSVSALAAFDTGSGPVLCAGGDFTNPGFPFNGGFATWDGSTWMFGGPFDSAVRTLAVHDDGGGPALYAGGDFTTVGVGAVSANSIAKMEEPGSWASLGSGMNGSVLALATFDDGSGPALHAGGSFGSAPDSLDSFIAKWGCPPPPPLWTDLGFALPGASGAPQLAGLGELTTGSTGRLTLTSSAPSAPAILFLALDSTPAPFKCGTLVPAPVVTSFVVVTNPIGEVLLGWSSWPAGLSGLSLYFQYGIQDAAAVCGVALSNALRADVP